MRLSLTLIGVLTLVVGFAVGRPPNIILIVADDMGYGDAPSPGQFFNTPNIDQMAAEGLRLTSFYQAASTCSASRAAMLTARYPERNGVTEDLASGGLDPEETTIAELLKEEGYKTGCIGKWHLGEEPKFLPKAQGFDVFFGTTGVHGEETPLMDGTEIIEESPDLSSLTRRYTQHAQRFIQKSKDSPFFLYLAHSMPSAPVFVSERFSGSADYGLYGDAVQEVDWSVGRVLETLDAEGLRQDTLVIFTSDNGPAIDAGVHRGDSAPFREGRATRYEGGHRVPCVMWFPEKIESDKVTDEIVSGLDLLPTFTAVAGARTPSNLDGLDLWPWLSGEEESSPRDTFHYGSGVVRKGPWKYFMPGKYKEYEDGELTERSYENSRLYYLPQDPLEQRSVHEDYTEFVLQLVELTKKHQAHLEGVEYIPPDSPEEESAE